MKFPAVMKKIPRTPALLLPGLVAAFFLSLSIGSAPVPVLGGLFEWLRGQAGLNALVMGEIRLPRTLLALCVGAALGLSGAALQGLLRNPLADPSLTGASQGAALGAAFVFYYALLPGLGVFAPLLAGLIGAGLTLLLTLWLAGPGRPALLLLAGLAIASLAGAALAAVLNFAPNPFAMQELVFWLLGSVSERGMAHLVFLLPALLIGSALIWRQRPLLAALSLGEQVAASLGLNVRRGGRIIVLGAAILVGSAVATAGNIGFVGLVAPHLARPLAQNRPERLLWPAAAIGALLVLLADMVVRLMPPGREIRLGVLTALIGAPLFIRLIWKMRREWL
ncbi:MAG: iron ABC transporter permease [Betaproteobacteria bacterium]|nr:iron ABC transporter permease [Betaproteobacteria bacterium]MCL2885572.1 iron ABC transporter permease [Betaproteobacteria bacterium]